MNDKLKEKLRHLRHRRYWARKRVDFTKRVSDVYLDKEIGFIACSVKGYHDIISPYSVKGYECLRPELKQYITDNAKYIPLEYPLVFEISGHHFTKEQQEMIADTIIDDFVFDLGEAQDDVSDNLKKMILLTIAFILSVLICLLFMKNLDNAFMAEIPFVLLYFTGDRMGETLLIRRPDCLEKQAYAARLAGMKISFEDVFVDEPLDENEEKEILEEIFSEEPEDE